MSRINEEYDGIIPLDIFLDKKDFGDVINVEDVGWLFLNYAHKAGRQLQGFMEKADNDGLMVNVPQYRGYENVAMYKPLINCYGREGCEHVVQS